MKFNLLALETSTSYCSVALIQHESNHIKTQFIEQETPQAHAMHILPMMENLLNQASLKVFMLNAIAFGEGPGSFTGLRMACGIAQALGFGLDIPLIPITSLKVIAAQLSVLSHQAVVVAIDARMQEIYLAVYYPNLHNNNKNEWLILQEPILIATSEIVAFIQRSIPLWTLQTVNNLNLVLAGDAWFNTIDPHTVPATWSLSNAKRPCARELALLAMQAYQRGEMVKAEHAHPLYIRQKIAFTHAEQILGAGGNPKAVSLF